MGNRCTWCNRADGEQSDQHLPGARRNEASKRACKQGLRTRDARYSLRLCCFPVAPWGPTIIGPATPAAPAFKESAVVPPPDLPGGGWKQVSPNDSAMRPIGGRFIRIPNWISSSSRLRFPTRRSKLPMSSTCRPGRRSSITVRSTIPRCRLVHRLRVTPVAKPSIVCSRQQDHLQRLVPPGAGFLGA